MSVSPMLPDGVFAAVLTPLLADLSIDHPGFARHCRRLLANGCDGLLIFGTTGEANSFAVSERMEALDRLIAAGAPPARLMVGAGCCALTDTVALCRHAAQRNLGGALIMPPFFYRGLRAAGVFQYFEQVIARVDDARLRLYFYHFPQMSGFPLDLALLERLRQAFPGVFLGIKDSSGDWAGTQRLCERLPDLKTYTGSETYLLDALNAGGAGCISATANITCREAGAIFQSWKNGDMSKDKQTRLTQARRAFETVPMLPALKHFMARQTGQTAWNRLRPPLMPLTAEEITRLEQSLAELDWQPQP